MWSEAKLSARDQLNISNIDVRIKNVLNPNSPCYSTAIKAKFYLPAHSIVTVHTCTECKDVKKKKTNHNIRKQNLFLSLNKQAAPNHQISNHLL